MATWLKAFWAVLWRSARAGLLFRDPGGFWPALKIVHANWHDPEALAELLEDFDDLTPRGAK